MSVGRGLVEIRSPSAKVEVEIGSPTLGCVSCSPTSPREGRLMCIRFFPQAQIQWTMLCCSEDTRSIVWSEVCGSEMERNRQGRISADKSVKEY